VGTRSRSTQILPSFAELVLCKVSRCSFGKAGNGSLIAASLNAFSIFALRGCSESELKNCAAATQRSSATTSNFRIDLCEAKGLSVSDVLCASWMERIVACALAVIMRTSIIVFPNGYSPRNADSIVGTRCQARALFEIESRQHMTDCRYLD